MPWMSVSTVNLFPNLVSPYKFMFYAFPLVGSAFAVSVESDSTELVGRRRVAFAYPILSAGGKVLAGGCLEVPGSAEVGATALVALTYGFAAEAFRTAVTDEVFGVAIAADRSIRNSVARLWRFA